MIDYIIGGIIAVLIVLALRALLFKKDEGSCSGCPYSQSCQKRRDREKEK